MNEQPGDWHRQPFPRLFLLRVFRVMTDTNLDVPTGCVLCGRHEWRPDVRVETYFSARQRPFIPHFPFTIPHCPHSHSCSLFPKGLPAHSRKTVHRTVFRALDPQLNGIAAPWISSAQRGTYSGLRCSPSAVTSLSI